MLNFLKSIGTKTFHFPRSISNNFLGFRHLINFYDFAKDIYDSKISVNLSGTKWFDANLCAVLGAIFIDLKLRNNKITLVASLENVVIDSFKKNHFLKYFGLDEAIDTYNTTIKFKVFSKEERTLFQEYLDKEFLPKISNDISMSDEFQAVLASNLDEVYQNARTHGNSDKIVVCGQWYPKSTIVKLTVVDLGVTIFENVRRLHPDKTPSEAIEWSTRCGTTTKSCTEPGGLGLYNLKEFICKNSGKMHIVSNCGYWGISPNKSKNISLNSFDKSFNGTIVNLEFNLKDANVYFTSEEENALLSYVDNLLFSSS